MKYISLKSTCSALVLTLAFSSALMASKRQCYGLDEFESKGQSVQPFFNFGTSSSLSSPFSFSESSNPETRLQLHSQQPSFSFSFASSSVDEDVFSQIKIPTLPVHVQKGLDLLDEHLSQGGHLALFRETTEGKAAFGDYNFFNQHIIPIIHKHVQFHGMKSEFTVRLFESMGKEHVQAYLSTLPQETILESIDTTYTEEAKAFASGLFQGFSGLFFTQTPSTELVLDDEGIEEDVKEESPAVSRKRLYRTKSTPRKELHHRKNKMKRFAEQHYMRVPMKANRLGSFSRTKDVLSKIEVGKLDLSGLGVGHYHITSLKPFLKKVEALDVSSNTIQDPTLILTLPTLKSVSFQNNGFDQFPEETKASSLINPMLEVLDMSQNPMSTAGARDILTMSKNMPNLHTLLLGIKTGSFVDGITALNDFDVTHPTLKVLSLSGWYLEPQNIAQILQLPALETLDLQGINLNLGTHDTTQITEDVLSLVVAHAQPSFKNIFFTPGEIKFCPESGEYVKLVSKGIRLNPKTL
ncbi:leucine-rich repeat domain-containing protein [Candidatus Nucleicultrix amoebiphila]|jgi:hypothetical protein|uniref:Uncharacterized protein n=1 Tax=Candidatus Nucleicultrix amoebiphila FS5 TaxID=1414854 RepID=A0A1W6N359_9PROT|nr:hypothetical protein [Candidatus Nucleicultrix amoebiphila]ARN84253.1 hypothetical protein GQ61_01645 [Candidatus Nucleicultrix amoebiphila FS5]